MDTVKRKIEWNESWDYRAHEHYWWTQRDAKGVCFDIRKRNDKFYLFACDELSGVHDTIDDAMNAAAEKWASFN